jgi:uncharacterized protein YhaN
MQFEISDEAAKTFAEELYSAIAESLPIDAAVAESRKTLFGSRLGQEWATPVLYMRSPSGLLFDVHPAEAPPEEDEEAERLRKEEAERLRKEEAERLRKEEAERQAEEARRGAEKERIAKEATAESLRKREQAERERRVAAPQAELERKAAKSTKTRKLFIGLAAIGLVIAVAVIANSIFKPVTPPDIAIDQRIEQFVRASEGPSAQSLREFYADTVSPYFALEHANWEEIQHDKEAYFNHFPTIHYTIIGKPQQSTLNNGDRVVEFTLDYSVVNRDGKASTGRVQDRMTLRMIGGSLKIVGAEELK